MKCIDCKKDPSEIAEYISCAADENCTPEDYVRREEGTYNSDTDTFCCTSCYIARGMPSSREGWKAS